MKRTIEHIGAALVVAGLFITSGVGVWWWFLDDAPVFASNSTFIEGPVTGNLLAAQRSAQKLRDCPLNEAQHYIVHGDVRVPLGAVVNRIVGAGERRGFTLVFPIPDYVENGTYRHEVDLSFNCNPLTELQYRVTSNEFELIR